MLTTAPTEEMIAEWKQIYEIHHSALKPNRKSGDEVDRYFRNNYSYQLLNSEVFREVVSLNITENDYFKRKLPKNVLPNVQTYQTGNVLVGIDLCTGEFHVESERVEEAIPIYDDLFVFRGLDAEDINNFFLVAEYIKLTQKERMV